MTNPTRGWLRPTIMALALLLVLSTFSGFTLAPASVGANSTLATMATQTAANKALKKSGTSKGIDVSKWNGKINWTKVANDGVKFAFVRATYGSTTVDPYFATNVKGARAAGVKVGAYHFATFKNSSQAKKEAQFFVKTIKNQTLTYPVVLDIEHKPGLSKAKMTELALEFISIVKNAGYKNVMIYASYNYFAQNLSWSKVKNFDLWVAHYLKEPSNLNPKVWQYGAKGRVKGISGDVDMNVGYADLSTNKSPSVAPAITSPRDNEADTDLPKSSTVTTTPKDSGADKAPSSGSGGSSSSPSGGSSNSSNSEATQVEKITDHLVNDVNIGTVIGRLNEWYGAGLATKASQVTVAQVNDALVRGFQNEINAQLDGSLTVDGTMTAAGVEKLATVPFKLDETKGRITTLVQAKLYMDGYYAEKMTGIYDSTMVEAIKALQTAKGIEASGTMTADTWKALFGI